MDDVEINVFSAKSAKEFVCDCAPQGNIHVVVIKKTSEKSAEELFPSGAYHG